MSRDGSKVVSQIPVNGTWKRGHEAVTDFEHAEVNLYPYPKIQDGNLPGSSQFFHVRTRSSDEQPFSLNEKVSF